MSNVFDFVLQVRKSYFLKSYFLISSFILTSHLLSFFSLLIYSRSSHFSFTLGFYFHSSILLKNCLSERWL